MSDSQTKTMRFQEQLENKKSKIWVNLRKGLIESTCG